MTVRIPARLLPALVATVAAGILPGCGSGGSADVGSGEVAQAAAATRDAGTAKLTLSVKTSGSALAGQTLSLAGTGQVDLKQHRIALQAKASGLSALGSDASFDEVLTGTTLYMRSPLLARAVGSGKWLKLDLQQLGSKLGINFSQLLSSGTSDPTQSLSYLRATSGSITKVGTETVRGASTTHYHATIDFSKYPDTVPPAQRDTAKQTITQLEKLIGTTKTPEDVWIDAQHRVRRVRASQDITPSTGPTAGLKAHVDTLLELYDFGAPVSITPPPASETTDASKILPGASTGGP